MASPKEQVLDLIRALPDDATIDDTMAELYFRIQVDAGLSELDAGKGISHEEAERRLAKRLHGGPSGVRVTRPALGAAAILRSVVLTPMAGCLLARRGTIRPPAAALFDRRSHS